VRDPAGSIDAATAERVEGLLIMNFKIIFSADAAVL